MDEDEQVLDTDLDESEESENSDDSGSDNSAPPKNEDSEDKSDKRVNDLMGNWQREQAKNKRLERELAALKSGKSGDTEESSDASDESGENEFLEFQRQGTRETLLKSDARLQKYGYTADDITGSTLSEMKASAQAALKKINAMESIARKEILTQHGLDPEVSVGTASEKAVDFASMSDEDFAKFLRKRDSLVR